MSEKQRENEVCSLRAVMYCRFSRDEQARVAVSLDEQQERLKSYCRAIGWMDQVQLFVDDGCLAEKLDRLELKGLLKSDYYLVSAKLSHNITGTPP